MATFIIKRGDTSPALRFALLPESVVLTDATVRFQMQRAGGGTVVDAAAAIVSTEPPVVEYAWSAGDTAEAGRFEAEFRVEYADGTIETFPNAGFIPVLIGKDVASLA